MLVHDEDARTRRRRAGRASAASNSCSAGLPMRIGGFDQIRSNRRSPGTASGSRTSTFVMPLTAAFAAAQLAGPFVDVDSDHPGGGRLPGQRERDRARAAAEVEEHAGRRRRRRLAEQDLRPWVERVRG